MVLYCWIDQKIERITVRKFGKTLGYIYDLVDWMTEIHGVVHFQLQKESI